MSPASQDESLPLELVLRIDAVCSRFRAAWREGPPPRIEDFLDGWAGPEQSALLRDLIEVDVDCRRRRGLPCTAEDYRGRFPGLSSAWLATAFGADAQVATTPPAGDTLPAGPPALGHRIGDYEVLEKIDRGGMGVVFKARQMSLNRVVALKMILAGAFADADQVRRFRMEAENAAGLDHPHIVPIHEVGEYDGQPFFSMKFIGGGTLAQHVGRFTADPKAAARLMATVARAVHFAHQRGILHRDLKPSNILLDAEGQPHVTDLGLAKRVEDRRGQTVSGAVIGTPGYMAPEQAAGKKGLTWAADVYGLGAVLYELLTGRPPFKAETPLDTILQVLEDEPVPPSRRRPGVPRDLEVICLKCLSKEPEKRYETAEALADELERYLAGEPIRTRRTPTWERGVKWARRRPAAAALATVIVLATAGLLGGWLHFTAQLQAETIQAQNDRDWAQRQEREAREQQAETARQLDRSRRTLFTAQLWRAAAIGEREPMQALRLLEDAEACPPDLRDFAWRLYRRRCNRLLGKLVGDTQYLTTDVAFSPQGTLLASASDDGTVKLWDVAHKRLVRTLKGHQETVRRVTFNRDGTMLASGSADGTVRLWDTAGQALAVLKGHEEVNAVAFSLDGKLLAAAYYRTVGVWDVTTGRLRSTRTCKGNTFAVRSVGFTPDGTNLLAWNGTDCVTFWDMATGKESGSIAEKAEGGVNAMALSPDGKTLVVFHGQESLNLWDVRTRASRGVLKGFAFGQRPVFTPDSRDIAVSHDRIATVVDIASGEPRLVLEADKDIDCLAFSEDGTICAAGNGNIVTLWDVSMSPWRDAQVPSRHIAKGIPRGRCVVLSRNGRFLANENGDGTLSLGFVDTGERQKGIKVGRIPFQGDVVALSSDGQRFAVLDEVFHPNGKDVLRTEVVLWDLVRRQESARLRLPSSSCTVMEFSPDSRTLATGSADGTLRLWGTANGTLTAALSGHTLPIRFLAFSVDGKTLVSGATAIASPSCKPGPVELLLWNTDTGRPFASIDWPPGNICGLALSPDGRTLAVAGCEEELGQDFTGIVRLWDVPTGKILLSHRGRCPSYESAAFSQDGKTLAVGEGGGGLTGCDVELWDVSTMQHRASLRGGLGDVDFVAFSPAGNTLLSWSWGRTVKLWEAEPISK
jgi:eukaryotic-like serine/threonine-protein kinase